MKKASEFWDKIAEKYSRQPIADEESYQRKLEITRSYLKPNMKVVELGCGTGSTAIIHAPYVEYIRAIDISPRMIEIAQQKAIMNGIKNITFETSSIEELKVENESLDAVLALSVLHLIENRGGVIKKIYEMLKPDGIFISSTICLSDDMKWLKLVAYLGKSLGFMPEVKFFTKNDLETGIERYGFKIEHSWKPGKRKAVFVVARKC